MLFLHAGKCGYPMFQSGDAVDILEHTKHERFSKATNICLKSVDVSILYRHYLECKKTDAPPMDMLHWQRQTGRTFVLRQIELCYIAALLLLSGHSAEGQEVQKVYHSRSVQLLH